MRSGSRCFSLALWEHPLLLKVLLGGFPWTLKAFLDNFWGDLRYRKSQLAHCKLNIHMLPSL